MGQKKSNMFLTRKSRVSELNTSDRSNGNKESSYGAAAQKRYSDQFSGLPKGLKRIQHKILLDFSLINPVDVIGAIQKGIEDDE